MSTIEVTKEQAYAIAVLLNHSEGRFVIERGALDRAITECNSLHDSIWKVVKWEDD